MAKRTKCNIKVENLEYLNVDRVIVDKKDLEKIKIFSELGYKKGRSYSQGRLELTLRKTIYKMTYLDELGNRHVVDIAPKVKEFYGHKRVTCIRMENFLSDLKSEIVGFNQNLDLIPL